MKISPLVRDVDLNGFLPASTYNIKKFSVEQLSTCFILTIEVTCQGTWFSETPENIAVTTHTVEDTVQQLIRRMQEQDATKSPQHPTGHTRSDSRI